MTEQNRIANKLINEKSPYLLQHAYNPVDWYPWNEEAFKKSKRRRQTGFSFNWLFNLSLVSCNGTRII